MDPLSLTASIIAVVGVGGQAAGAIRRIAAIAGSSDIVLALNNEITDLHRVVSAIQDALERQQSTVLPLSISETGYHQSVTTSLQQALDKTTELEALYSRLKPDPSNACSPRSSGKFRKLAWLREQSNIRQMLDDLKSVRLKLAGALGILNLYAKYLFSAIRFSILSCVID